MKPEVVVLTVEGFHALYVSNALHLATSWEFTTVVLTLDLAQFWLSMLDVIVTLREVQVLMTKIPREHSIANENFLQVAMRILAVDGAARPGVNSLNPATEPRFSGLRSGKAPDTEREPLYTDSVRVNNSKLQRYSITKQALFQGAQVVPLVTPDKFQARLLTTADKLPPEMDIAAIFSLADRALFIDKATRVLFITEYIVLIEYTEVMLPIIYSLHDIVLFYMHNGSFYPVLTGCSSAELLWSIVNVLVYAVLEFVSLVMVCLVLKRTLGFSSWKQLAFVLETQAASIQNKMTVTFLYAMQISLIHLGT
ncbi:hypothetical protein V7S43_001614 [Phytophthora oleae]|uniref:Uncharacterized protein n=1 Tax=Phytophthora oleae TaxID=2107226 RepID=A0ABD3G6V7_9STRA